MTARRRPVVAVAEDIATRAYRRGEIVDLNWWFARNLLDTADGDPDAIDLAIAALERVRSDLRPHRGGRPKGSGVLPRHVLLREVQLEATRLWGERPGGPTLALVAAAIGYSEDGLSRALQRRGIDWRAVRDDSERQAFGRVSVGKAR